jgi:DnaJ-class molecular chaperone
MTEDEYKSVIEEFFFRLYFQSYKENGLSLGDVYEPQLLEALGLPLHAGLLEVKKRFRELAMRYHPDHGGNADQFMELMDTYTQITGGKNKMTYPKRN